MIQQLETVLKEAVKVPKNLHLNEIRIVDNGDGKTISSLVKVYPEIINQFFNSVKQTLGVDVVGILTNQDSNQTTNGNKSNI